MDVEIRDLRWAMVASQHRSLRQAAETLNVRQSTLSRRLRDVERLIGAQLFERSNGGSRPTIVGLEFLAIAQRILAEADAAIRQLKSRSRGENGRLTIGVQASLATGNMRATLIEHHSRFPEVDVHIADGTRDRLLCGLMSSAVDIAVMVEALPDWDGRMLPLWSERVIVALPEADLLAGISAVQWSDLANERLLLPQHGAGPELERLLTEKLHASYPPHILHHDASLDHILSLVSIGQGVLVMLEGATGIRCDSVVYREVHDHDGPTRLNFRAYWKGSSPNPTLSPFLDLLRERYPDLSIIPD